MQSTLTWAVYRAEMKARDMSDRRDNKVTKFASALGHRMEQAEIILPGSNTLPEKAPIK